MLEVPAGKIELDGESPEICAIRELEEEAAVKCGELIPLGYVYTSPGFCNEKIYLYLARKLTPGQQHLDDDEFMVGIRLYKEIYDEIKPGEPLFTLYGNKDADMPVLAQQCADQIIVEARPAAVQEPVISEIIT